VTTEEEALTIQLPEELQRFVEAEVNKGHFASADEAISQAVQLLRQRAQQMTEDEWEQSLVQSGLLASIPPRPTAAPRQFEPVRKPLPCALTTPCSWLPPWTSKASRTAIGLPPITLLSADRDLNAAATLSGLLVEDPTLHP
jgi:putative addiction module CopG family antidote